MNRNFANPLYANPGIGYGLSSIAQAFAPDPRREASVLAALASAQRQAAARDLDVLSHDARTSARDLAASGDPISEIFRGLTAQGYADPRGLGTVTPKLNATLAGSPGSDIAADPAMFSNVLVGTGTQSEAGTPRGHAAGLANAITRSGIAAGPGYARVEEERRQFGIEQDAAAAQAEAEAAAHAAEPVVVVDPQTRQTIQVRRDQSVYYLPFVEKKDSVEAGILNADAPYLTPDQRNAVTGATTEAYTQGAEADAAIRVGAAESEAALRLERLKNRGSIVLEALKAAGARIAAQQEQGFTQANAVVEGEQAAAAAAADAAAARRLAGVEGNQDRITAAVQNSLELQAEAARTAQGNGLDTATAQKRQNFISMGYSPFVADHLATGLFVVTPDGEVVNKATGQRVTNEGAQTAAPATPPDAQIVGGPVDADNLSGIQGAGGEFFNRVFGSVGAPIPAPENMEQAREITALSNKTLSFSRAFGGSGGRELKIVMDRLVEELPKPNETFSGGGEALRGKLETMRDLVRTARDVAGRTVSAPSGFTASQRADARRAIEEASQLLAEYDAALGIAAAPPPSDEAASGRVRRRWTPEGGLQ